MKSDHKVCAIIIIFSLFWVNCIFLKIKKAQMERKKSDQGGERKCYSSGQDD